MNAIRLGFLNSRDANAVNAVSTTPEEDYLVPIHDSERPTFAIYERGRWFYGKPLYIPGIRPLQWLLPDTAFYEYDLETRWFEGLRRPTECTLAATSAHLLASASLIPIQNWSTI